MNDYSVYVGGMLMHKIFGTKMQTNYIDREGAYLVAVRDNRIAMIKTAKGYFLPGGGKEKDETDEECIIRECLEETGCTAEIIYYLCTAEAYMEHPDLGLFHPIQNYYFGNLSEQAQDKMETDHMLLWLEYEEIKGKMFVEMQEWALGIFLQQNHISCIDR